MGRNYDFLFTIIVVDYEGSVARQDFVRAIRHLADQTYQNFEIILFHDGPKNSSYEQELEPELLQRINRIVITENRYNDWGHSLRDQGIYMANGAYIVHHNADNFLYPRALELIKDTIYLDLPDFVHESGQVYNNSDLIVFPILMRGMTTYGIRSGHRKIVRKPEFDKKIGFVLNGFPPAMGTIDCMQVVMKTDLWIKEGGWKDKGISSDARLYKKFTRKYGVRNVMEVIAEHW